MNPSLARLCQLAQQPSRRIIGLMSGTSLDGLDVALCRLEGHGAGTHLTVEHFASLPYSDDARRRIRLVFAREQVQLQDVALLHAWLGRHHAELVLHCLREWKVSPAEVDAIASHGQTVFHAPQHQHHLPDWPHHATLQLGDADQIAVLTGIITLSDFRQKHVAAGGEGAPLATYGDYLLYASPAENRLLLNLGGIANFTYLPASLDATAVFSTDTGPANTLLDAFARGLYPGQQFDQGGRLAATGQVNQPLLQALLQHPFFVASLPKTTGPEVFNPDYVRAAQQQTHTTALPPPDLLATLTELTAASVALAVRQTVGTAQTAIYASGGGVHNPVLMQALQRHLPAHAIGRTEQLGVAADAKEAVLFAVLANETLAGQATALGHGAQTLPAVTFGKISLPG